VTFFERILDDVKIAMHESDKLAERLDHVFAAIADHMAGAAASGRDTTVDLIRATQDAGSGRDENEQFQRALEVLVTEGVNAGEVSTSFAARTYAEMITAVYFGLIASWIQDDAYPVERKAAEAARFLTHALARRETIESEESRHGST
jgi:hypothetical protein